MKVLNRFAFLWILWKQMPGEGKKKPSAWSVYSQAAAQAHIHKKALHIFLTMRKLTGNPVRSTLFLFCYKALEHNHSCLFDTNVEWNRKCSWGEVLVQKWGCFSAASGLAPYKTKETNSRLVCSGMVLFLGADHGGSIDVTKAELTLFKQKMLIIWKLGVCAAVSFRDMFSDGINS